MARGLWTNRLGVGARASGCIGQEPRPVVVATGLVTVIRSGPGRLTAGIALGAPSPTPARPDVRRRSLCVFFHVPFHPLAHYRQVVLPVIALSGMALSAVGAVWASDNGHWRKRWFWVCPAAIRVG